MSCGVNECNLTKHLSRISLTTSAEAQYSVYNDLESAEACILLPSKVRKFPVLQSDTATVSATPQLELLPECVGVNEVQPYTSNTMHAISGV